MLKTVYTDAISGNMVEYMASRDDSESGGGLSTAWREAKYDEVYESTLGLLAYRKAREKDFSLDDARRILDDQYVSEGNDWIGRGELGDIVMSATIAACEHCIAEWKNEIRSATEERR